ncbi:MAG: hypothetical protein Q8P30_01785 [Candidatus Uhrbacteria bacterium]|nr:hypothetical protein [Candidatus Uhrbacteria bacterium]
MRQLELFTRTHISDQIELQKIHATEHHGESGQVISLDNARRKQALRKILKSYGLTIEQARCLPPERAIKLALAVQRELRKG